MKIEVGKQYRMANGDVATIMEFKPGADYPWRGMFGTVHNGGSMSWDDTGEQCNRAEGYRLLHVVVDEPVAAHVERASSFASQIAEMVDAENIANAFTQTTDDEPTEIRLRNPLTLGVTLLDDVGSDVAAMAAIEQVMSCSRFDDLRRDGRSRVAAWFNARYGS